MYTLAQRSLGELAPQEYLAVPEHYRKQRLCVLCGATFHEYSNMGQLRCRLHPGELRYYEEYDCYAFSCCQRASTEVGCVACDHIDTFFSDTLPQRWSDIKAWLLAAVPHGLFWFGIQTPQDRYVLMNRGTSVRQQLTLRLTLPDVDRGGQHEQLQLDSQTWQQRVAKQAANSVLLVQLLSTHRDERQRRRDDALGALEQQRQRRQGGLRTENAQSGEDSAQGGTRLPSFIPFVVLRRVDV